MNEEKTFNILRRCSVDEMEKYLMNIPSPIDPVISVCGIAIYRDGCWSEVNRYMDWIQCLEEHGWSVVDFSLELEKRSIKEIIKEINGLDNFPQDLITRVLKTFPNAKFTPASIEVE